MRQKTTEFDRAIDPVVMHLVRLQKRFWPPSAPTPPPPQYATLADLKQEIEAAMNKR